jgi:hypothetical protein
MVFSNYFCMMIEGSGSGSIAGSGSGSIPLTSRILEGQKHVDPVDPDPDSDPDPQHWILYFNFVKITGPYCVGKRKHARTFWNSAGSITSRISSSSLRNITSLGLCTLGQYLYMYKRV